MSLQLKMKKKLIGENVRRNSAAEYRIQTGEVERNENGKFSILNLVQ